MKTTEFHAQFTEDIPEAFKQRNESNMTATYSPTMVPTEHEKAEWSRLAQDAYANDRNDLGAKFSVSASYLKGESMTLAKFDELQRIYRQWLIGGLSSVTF